MRHLRHKTADKIYEHDFNLGPLHLYGGYSDEFESLLWYVNQVAPKFGRLRISFAPHFRGTTTISKVRD